MTDLDQVLLESTRTHRSRLVAALVHGPVRARRPVNDNRKRFVGSVVLTAVIGVGCLGFSFVMDLLESNREKAALSAFRQAQSANPLQPSEFLVPEEGTGFLRDAESGDLLDPRTGFVIDEATGYATDQDGRTIDPRTSWFVDPDTGYYTDPASGVTIDPVTTRIVENTEPDSEQSN